MSCKSNLRQIGVALHNYETNFRVLPPGYLYRSDPRGNSMGFGWGTMILPFLEEAAVYAEFDWRVALHDEDGLEEFIAPFRIKQEAAAHAREVDGQRTTERAGGLGAAEEEQATGERDADGHRLWENPSDPPSQDAPPAETEPPGPKDPSGACGSQLDLRG